ncbi:MAG TPA: cyclic nucleotide-binding domain-containing protein [Ktedonobacterales bacterium]|jgi:hypothetical protein
MAIAQPRSSKRSNLVRIKSVPPSIIFMTIAASWLGMVSCILLKYPLVIVATVTLVPWIPLFISEATWKYRHYAWFAFYEILFVTQGLHFIEHIAQILQVYVLGVPRADAHGIFGNLDAEFVHFFFDTSLEIGVIILLFRFRKNIALWITFAIGLWHTSEHWYITYYYVFNKPYYTAHAKNGLLAQGGLLWPTSPLPRIELHFLYNLLFTIPLIWGFIIILRDAYDEYLKNAFPRLSESQLASINSNIDAVQVDAGELIIRQGEPADKFYIISKGEVEILQEAGGPPIIVNRLSQGQFFGEVGLLTGAPRNASVRAVTRCDLLALSRDTFRAVIGNSAPTAQDFAQVLAQRGSSPAMAAVAVGAPVGAAASGPSYPQAVAPGIQPPSNPGFYPPSGPSYPQASGPSYPQASNPAVPQASGPSYPQASAPTIPPANNPGFAGPPPVAPPQPAAPIFQTAPGNAIEGPTALTPGSPGWSSPNAVKTVDGRAPIFRDAANSWSYGLVFTGGQLKGQGVMLSASRMQIGRDLGNEIRISDDAQVSRRHVELLRTPSGEYQLHDLRSSNGVFLNGQRLAADETRLLQENDEVKVGNSTFTLRKVGTRVV